MARWVAIYIDEGRNMRSAVIACRADARLGEAGADLVKGGLFGFTAEEAGYAAHPGEIAIYVELPDDPSFRPMVFDARSLDGSEIGIPPLFSTGHEGLDRSLD